MMRVKVCGLCSTADAELALALGATHLGCVVAADSPRQCAARTIDSVRQMARGLAAFVLVVRGVEGAFVQALYGRYQPDLVQWHGASEVAEHALRGVVPLLKVRDVAVGAAVLPDTSAASPQLPMVLDGGRGGAGRRFDWQLLPGGGPAHTFVAGGITADNVAALRLRHPWGIDVASGIERAPGHKDHGAMRALFAAIEVQR